MTLVTGQFLKPDGSPIAGVTVKAYLAETAGESNGKEIYASAASVETVSDSTGSWSMSLWANSNGVLPTKYVFIIKYTNTSNDIRYELVVPNETEVFFSDLMVSYSNTQRDNQLIETEAIEYDFSITRGNTVRKVFDLIDSSNQPMDLTGWNSKIYMQTPEGVIHEVLLTVEALEGKLALHLNDFFTWDLSGSVIYELYLYSTADTLKLMYGKIEVKPSLFAPKPAGYYD